MKTFNNRHKSQYGFTHIVVMSVVLSIIIAAVVVVFTRQKQHTEDLRRQKTNATAQDSKVQTTLDTKSTEKTVTPTETPADTNPAAAPKVVSPTTKPVTATPTTTTITTQDPTIVFSSTDPCMVTITGTPGTSVEIGANNGRKGGSMPYTIPTSGTITKTSGGTVLNPAMTAYGIVYGANGETILSKQSTQPITANCPIPG